MRYSNEHHRGQVWPRGDHKLLNFSEASQQAGFALTVVNTIHCLLAARWFLLHQLFKSAPLIDSVNVTETIKKKLAN